LLLSSSFHRFGAAGFLVLENKDAKNDLFAGVVSFSPLSPRPGAFPMFMVEGEQRGFKKGGSTKSLQQNNNKIKRRASSSAVFQSVPFVGSVAKYKSIVSGE
jgi:hypothetical protein